LTEYLVGVNTWRRQRLGRHTPHGGHMRTMFGIREVSSTGQLIALLAVLTTTLAIGLSRDSRIPAAFASDTSRCQHDIDGAETVLDAVTVMLDAARVHEKTGFCSTPPFGRLSNRFFGNTGYFRGVCRCPLLHARCELFEAGCVIANELMIKPVVLNHQMQ